MEKLWGGAFGIDNVTDQSLLANFGKEPYDLSLQAGPKTPVPHLQQSRLWGNVQQMQREGTERLLYMLTRQETEEEEKDP